MVSTVSTVRDISQIPIERIIAFPMKDLLWLVREADEALAEAKSLKNWINGIMALKRSMSSNHSNSDYGNADNYKEKYIGGQNEQTTDY